jgi:hypothetical protein
MWKPIKIVSGVLALAFWFSSFVVWMFYSVHRPHVSVEGSGRRYPLETHGSVVYLTAAEHDALYGLMIAGIAFATIAAFSHVLLRRGSSPSIR